jgi:murein DD-endopeptidase MepM/ murein hydrolase activator NlpD
MHGRNYYWVVVLWWCTGCSTPVAVDSTRIPAPLPATVTTTLLPVATPTHASTATLLPRPAPPTPTPWPVRTQQLVQATAAVQSPYTYVFPVSGVPVTYGREHHDYMATDIFCDDGAPFVAVVDGVIDYIETTDRWDPTVDDPASRSGLAVAIIGVDGNRYYGSHLQAVAPGLVLGMHVRAGDVLGYTGRSGNARHTPPHLHFGISRPTFPDDWQVRRGEMNPYTFLQAWEKGESLQPVFAP